MTRFWILLGALLLPVSASAENKVFKTTDEDGNPVFSDQVTDDSEEIDVEEPMTFESDDFTERRDTSQYRDSKRNEEPAVADYKVAVTYPEHDQAIRSNPGDVELRYSVKPGLQAGHRIEVYLDGSKHSTVQGSGTVSFTNLDRGTHTAQVKVTGQDGSEIRTSDPVSFHVLRHSIK